MSINYGRGSGTREAEEEPAGSVPRGSGSGGGADELDTDRDGSELTAGETPAQIAADDETRAPEEEGGDDPRPDQ